MEDLANKLEFIMTRKEFEQTQILNTKDGIVVTINAHEHTCREARTLINNVVASCRQPFYLHVIHGFHGGEDIRTMIWEDHFNPRFEVVKGKRHNRGESIIKVAGVAS